MPTDDCLGFYDDEGLNPARPDVAKENPEEPVASPEPRPLSSLLQNGKLLTQGSIFESEIKSWSEKSAQGM